MRMALVHDYLIQDGGAERVLQVFHDMYPEAPTYVLFHDPKRVGPAFDGREIHTSFLQTLPFGLRAYKWTLPLMPAATEHYDLSGYDVVLSSTSAFAKGVITRPETVHFCYCHTPTRYLWSDTHTYINELNMWTPVKRLAQGSLSRIRLWDRMAADRVDRFIANSETVRQRIKKYYGRDAVVIYPPVETDKFAVTDALGDYYLAGGRLVAYKRFDIVVRAFTKLGIPLKIFGEGPEYARLKKEAGRNIEFLGKVSEADKAELYAKALAYLNPQEEDFGITAIEAMAAGRPVIAYRKGGATETVLEGETGEFIDEQSWEELGNTILRFDPRKYDPHRIRQHAQTFDTKRFEQQLREYIQSELRQMKADQEDRD
jgi:glycosyltransferase involved in cell wall biosynthesis